MNRNNRKRACQIPIGEFERLLELPLWEELRRHFVSERGLSKRESEIAIQYMWGKSDREIAEALKIGLQTVNKHGDHIKEKLGIPTRSAVAVFALNFVANRKPTAPICVSADIESMMQQIQGALNL